MLVQQRRTSGPPEFAHICWRWQGYLLGKPSSQRSWCFSVSLRLNRSHHTRVQLYPCKMSCFVSPSLFAISVHVTQQKKRMSKSPDSLKKKHFVLTFLQSLVAVTSRVHHETTEASKLKRLKVSCFPFLTGPVTNVLSV